MHYQVWKWPDHGEAGFRIHVHPGRRRADRCCSGSASSRGRRQQPAYYRSVCRRMRRLTEAQLELNDVRRREQRQDD